MKLNSYKSRRMKVNDADRLNSIDPRAQTHRSFVSSRPYRTAPADHIEHLTQDKTKAKSAKAKSPEDIRKQLRATQVILHGLSRMHRRERRPQTRPATITTVSVEEKAQPLVRQTAMIVSIPKSESNFQFDDDLPLVAEISP